MYKHIFWQNISLNWEIAVLIGLVSIFLHFFIFRKHIYSFFDPLVYNLLLSSMANSVPIFLYIKGHISNFYFISFLSTQIAYIFGFLLCKPINLHKTRLLANNTEILMTPTLKIMYFLTVVVLVFAQMTVYFVSGIPLFMESRLEIFAEGGGYGLLNRFLGIGQSIVITMVIYKLMGSYCGKLKVSLFDKVAIFWVGLFLILSGSKSSFLSIIFGAFFVNLFFQKYSLNNAMFYKLRRLQFLLLISSIVLAMMVIVIQSNSDYPFIALLMRIVNTGDVFMLSYPNGFLEKMEPGNPILATFQDLLGSLRIFSWKELPKNLGQQLYQNFNKSTRVAGPNSRHNVFGLHYYGPYVSIILSFCLGVLCSFLRNKLFVFFRPNLLNLIVYSLIGMRCFGLEADTPVALGNFNSIFFVLGFLYLCSKLIKKTLDFACEMRIFRGKLKLTN